MGEFGGRWKVECTGSIQILSLFPPPYSNVAGRAKLRRHLSFALTALNGPEDEGEGMLYMGV